MLKKKILKEEFEGLNEVVKDFYTMSEDGETYSLQIDGEEDVGALKRAKEHEVKKRRDVQQKLDALLAEKAKWEEKESLEPPSDAKKTDPKFDIKELEKRFDEKYGKVAKELEAKLKAKTTYIEESMLREASMKLSSELLPDAPKLLDPHVRAKLRVEYDGDEPQIVVLDENNQISGQNLEDLKKNFIANPDFASIIQVNRATGSGANSKVTTSKAVPKSGNLRDMTEAEIVEFSISDPEGFAKAVNN